MKISFAVLRPHALAALASMAVVLLADPDKASDALNKARIPVDALALRPVDTRHLAISIELAMKNRMRLARMARDSAERRMELEQRKLVERAKGILMSKNGLGPPAGGRLSAKNGRPGQYEHRSGGQKYCRQSPGHGDTGELRSYSL